MPLNDLRCKNAKPNAKPYKLADTESLYLYVKPNGSKLWRFDYRFFQKHKTLSFGSYPSVSLVEARKKREEAKVALRRNEDPGFLKATEHARLQEANAFTVERLLREWYEHSLDNWGYVQGARNLRRMESDLFPDIGHIPAFKLTSGILTNCLKKVAKIWQEFQFCCQNKP